MEPVDPDHLDILITILSATEPTAKRFTGTPEEVLQGIITYARSYDADGAPTPQPTPEPSTEALTAHPTTRNGRAKHTAQRSRIEELVETGPSGARLVDALLVAVKGKQADAARALVENFGPDSDRKLFPNENTAEAYLSALKGTDYLEKGLRTALQAKRLLSLVVTAGLAKEHALYRPTIELAAKRLGFSGHGSTNASTDRSTTRTPHAPTRSNGHAERVEGMKYLTTPKDLNERLAIGVHEYFKLHGGMHGAADHLYELGARRGSHTYTSPILLAGDLSRAARGVIEPALVRLLSVDPVILATAPFVADLADFERAATEQSAR